jgi:hypothetical protein
MKHLAFLFLFGLLSTASFSQYVHKIKADSVKITNDSCNAELILENSTRNVQGSFLYNKGNGRTEFRKVLTKFSANVYLVGADTLQVSPPLDAVLNQYQQRQVARAWLDSMKLSKATFLGTDTTGEAPFLLAFNSAGKPMFQLRAYTSVDGYGNSLYLGDNAGANAGPRTGAENVGIGTDALKSTAGWGFNVAVGAYAMKANVSSGMNTAVGYNSLRFLNGGLSNTAIGSYAFYSQTGGGWNTAVGNNAGINFISGNDNTLLGQSAGAGLASGSYNVVIGGNTLSNVPVANYNTIVGHAAGGNATGSNNVFLGRAAGLNNTGSSNVFLGYNAGAYSGDKSNTLYIHNTGTETPLIYGEFANGRLVVNGTLSVNDSDPSNLGTSKFYVNGSSYLNGSVKLAGVLNLPASAAPTSSSDTSGSEGDLKRDAAGNLYLKANGQWLKFTGAAF